MASNTVKWTPGADVRAAFQRGSVRGVGIAAEYVLAESRKQVPHDTGVLERSGRASTEQSGDTARGAVSYDTPYAVDQHEGTHYRHRKGRKAKYLEDPLNSSQGKVAGIIAAELRGEL